MRFHRLVVGVLVGVAMAGLTACADGATDAPAGGTSVLSADEAEMMLVSALEAFNAEDYAAWSAGWSEQMRSAIPEDAFQSFVRDTRPTTGRFVSAGPAELVSGKDAGYIRWQTTAEFEEARIRFAFSMKASDRTVHGVFFDPVP